MPCKKGWYGEPIRHRLAALKRHIDKPKLIHFQLDPYLREKYYSPYRNLKTMQRAWLKDYQVKKKIR